MGIFDFFKKNKNIKNDNGLNETYFDDGMGDINKRYYKKNGKKEGLYQYYTSNGKLTNEYNYTNGEKDGIQKNYINKGFTEKITIEEITYKNGDPIYYKEFLENVLHKEGEIKDYDYNSGWIFKGDYKQYDINTGKIHSITTWKGKYHIKKRLFYENGEVNQEHKFKKGELESKKIFYENGKIQSEILYPNLPPQFTKSQLYKFRSIDVVKHFKEDEHELSVKEITDLYLYKTTLESTLLLIELKNGRRSNFSGSPFDGILPNSKELRKNEFENGKNVHMIINGYLFLVNYKEEKITEIKLSKGNFDCNGVVIDKDEMINEYKPKKETTTKTKKVEKKKSDFGKQYHDLEETLLGEDSSYIEEYGFIKLLREKLNKGEVKDMLDLKSYIKNHHKKYDGGEIMFKTDLYNQLEHMFTVYLEEWEKKKETNFVGFEDVEQYHSLSQKIVIELGDLLQEKIRELGK